jgi:hypothetical protein
MPLETLIGSIFAVTLGSQLAMGLVALLMLVVFGVAFKLTFEGLLVMLLPAIFLLSLYGYLPLFILVGVVILCGFIIFMAVMKTVRR